MPYTPIHLSIAYLARKIRPSLSLPALIVGSMVPDLEIPFVYIITGGQYGRLILHSFVGAAMFATLLSVALTVFVYSPVISHIFKLDSKILRKRCRFSWSLVAVCFFGGLSHVSIDALHHQYNPLLFPFSIDSFDSLVLLNDWTLASVIIPVMFLLLLIFLILEEIRRGTNDIWYRLLVG